MVFEYGMSNLGTLAIPSFDEDVWFKLSDDLKNKAYEEMSAIVQRAEKETQQFLLQHQLELTRLAEHLLKVRTVDGELIDEVLDGLLNEPTLKVPAFQDAESNEAQEVTAIVEKTEGADL